MSDWNATTKKENIQIKRLKMCESLLVCMCACLSSYIYYYIKNKLHDI